MLCGVSFAPKRLPFLRFEATRQTKHTKYIFLPFLCFFLYILPLAGPNIAKKGGALRKWRGVLGKPILELLTFGSNLDLGDLRMFCVFLRMSYGDPYIKGPKITFFINFFSFFSRIFGPRGGCASSRLDHGLEIRAGRLR